MRQKLSKFLFFLIIGIFSANFAFAQPCPVCVVAIGAGLGLSRWLGIDDVVSSIWIGAFLVGLISWTLSYMKKKGWSFRDDGIVITLAYILFTYIPLYYAGIVGHPQNQIFGLDKIIFGSIVGVVVSFSGYLLHYYLKKTNNGKSFFPYQRVIVPVVTLLAASMIFYFLILYRII
jgi:hypothetical protein